MRLLLTQEKLIDPLLVVLEDLVEFVNFPKKMLLMKFYLKQLMQKFMGMKQRF